MAVCLMIVAVALVASVLLTELALEARDVARYMPGQTFATVGDARIRYRLLGAEHTGTTVVFLSGLSGSIEQVDDIQRAVSSAVPSLAYDRAGYGFSQGSTAHSTEEQAKELAALLQALKLEGPVVLVAYSSSAPIARIFAGCFPEKTAGMYLIDPIWGMPEVYERMPHLHGPRRRLVRFIVHQLLASSLGYIRLTQRMRSWQGPTSFVDRRAEAVLARRPHYWALAQEWYALPKSMRRALVAPIPPSLPLEVAFLKQVPEDETSKTAVELYTELVARSNRGKLLELEGCDHTQLLQEGPVLDRLVVRIKQFARVDAKTRGTPVANLPGTASPSPGRPLSSRQRISERLLGDLVAVWEEHGKSVLERLATTDPGKLATITYGLLPRDVFINVQQQAPGNPEPEIWASLRRVLDLIEACKVDGDPQSVFAAIEKDLRARMAVPIDQK